MTKAWKVSHTNQQFCHVCRKGGRCGRLTQLLNTRAVRVKSMESLKGSMSAGAQQFFLTRHHLARLMNLFFPYRSSLKEAKWDFHVGFRYERRDDDILRVRTCVFVCLYVCMWIIIIGKWMNNKIIFSSLPKPAPRRMSSGMIHKYYLHVFILKFFFFGLSHAQLIWKINFIV